VDTEPVDNTAPVGRLDLAPEDYEQLSWWPEKVYARAVPEPFDSETCVERLKACSDEELWNTEWDKAQLPLAMTPQEARFWLSAMILPFDGAVTDRAVQLVSRSEAPTPPLEKALGWLRGVDGSEGEWVILCVGHLYEAEAFWRALFEKEVNNAAAATSPVEEGWVAMARGFGRYWLPFLNLHEREAMRTHVRSYLSRTRWPRLSTSGNYRARPLPWLMAAQLGMCEEVATVVEGWADDSFQGSQGRIQAYNQAPQEMILRLGSSDLVEYHMRRLKLTPRTPEQIRTWLAATEFRGLDLVRDRILNSRSKSGAVAGINELGRALTPETALLMLQISLESKAAKTAQQWLDRHPRLAAYGLVAEAGRRSKAGEAALELLRGLCRHRQRELVKAALGTLPEESQAKVRQRLADELEQ
jgi:hypothetical protein